jgi:SAM-dependent methyltransferase
VPGHRDVIQDQFTKQAVPFSNAPGIRDEEALALVVDAVAAGPEDTVLDVACGPGLVVSAFARVVRRAIGVDVTPAMLARAQSLARERGLQNVEWVQADAPPLPIVDGAFSVVVSRFAFHHLSDPAAVLADMTRACRRGGRVAVVDLLASSDPVKAAAMNRMERLRDPSHARALDLAELSTLFPAVGLPEPRASFYRLRAEVEGVLARSFPAPGDADRIRAMFVESLTGDTLGLGTHRKGDELRFAYPVAILVAERS